MLTAATQIDDPAGLIGCVIFVLIVGAGIWVLIREH